MSLVDSVRLPSLLLIGCFTCLAACPDPQAEYDAFKERFDQVSLGGASACEPFPVVEGGPDGTYLFSLSAKLSPKKAFALDATLVTTEGADGLDASLTLQPLSAEDQSTPVGDALTFNDLTIAADGTFHWEFGEVTLAGAANPISGADIISTLIFDGFVCGGPNAGFICGDASGIVSQPIMGYDLTGSTFTMQRYDGSEKPEPLINCDRDPAQY